MHTRDEVIISKEIRTEQYLFRLEEYWEEDDAGYCVSDFVLAKHTRLTVLRPDETQIRQYDFDGKEYEKDLRLEGKRLVLQWFPEYNRKRRTVIDTESLEVIEDTVEETAP